METVLVTQNSHQLGHTNRRVRVVEVNRHVFRQVVQCGVFVQVALDQILHGSGDKKILLLEAQLTPSRCAVVRVKHPGDVFKLIFGAGGAGVVTGVERAQVKVGRGHGFP